MKKKDKWDKLLKLIDEEGFSISDFLAVICANLANSKEDGFKTTMVVGGKMFNIEFSKRSIQ